VDVPLYCVLYRQSDGGSSSLDLASLSDHVFWALEWVGGCRVTSRGHGYSTATPPVDDVLLPCSALPLEAYLLCTVPFVTASSSEPEPREEG